MKNEKQIKNHGQFAVHEPQRLNNKIDFYNYSLCERCQREVRLEKIPSQPGKQIITGTCQHCFTVIKWEEPIKELKPKETHHA